eukprot:GHUV01015674.1.p1 GENE.GHUV01015674.1~~GHUV01015674.1.p1  ORF type:complete len:171 (+),score=14.63 GHUV01015674.1:206-718(+)
MLTLWMVLTAMIIFTFVVPVAGILSDRGLLRPVNATIGICVVAAGMSVPMFLAFQTKHLAACWLLQIVSLCMTAYTMGILPVICSNIYPAGVRISGFNLGYNLGEWIGLLSVHEVEVAVTVSCSPSGCTVTWLHSSALTQAIVSWDSSCSPTSNACVPCPVTCIAATTDC